MGCGGRGGLQLILLGLDTAVGGGAEELACLIFCWSGESWGSPLVGWISLFPLGALQVGGGTGLVEA